MTKDKFIWMILVWCCICTGSAEAQELKVWKQVITTPSSGVLKIETDNAFNGISLRTLPGKEISGYIETGEGKSYRLSVDQHAPEEFTQSNLVHFDKPIRSLILHLDGQITPLEIWFQYVPPLAPIPRPAGDRGQTPCDQPQWIPQSYWRTGLPTPGGARRRTPTQHCVIHHAASSNADTNYTELVRSFYIYHTQVNGWDDIGYNFLIAANGDLYAGRDPLNSGIAQDEVLGAHFCGKNGYTMGVCMIGDYDFIPPTDASVEKLVTLLSWKSFKDGLDPLGVKPHPDSLSGAELNVICGHRDGCSTSCPGDYVYEKLYQFRDQVKERIGECRAISATDLSGDPVIAVYPNPSNDRFVVGSARGGQAGIASVKVFSISGVLYAYIERADPTGAFEIDANNWMPGVYWLEVRCSNGNTLHQKITKI